MLRPGLTAIAAVLALSANPSLAQSADAPMVTPPPVAASPAPAPTAAPTVSAAPAPIAALAGGVVTSPVVGTVSPEVAAQVAAAKAAPAPEPTVTSTAADEPAPAPVRRTTTTRTETRTTRTAAPVEAAPAPAPVAAAPVIAAPVAPAPVAPAPVVKAAPAPAPTQTTTTVDMDEALPIAGAAAVGLLLIGGGAYAFSRRRRNDEVVYEEPYVEETMVAPAPAVATAAPMAGNVTAAPAFTAPLMAGDTQSGAHAVATAPSGPTTTLPNGFDLSRFGRHTQAAYRGPTPENPSLSLRKRLKVASFYDGRERMAREGKNVETFAPSAPIPAAAAERRTTTDHITVRAPARPRGGFRPVYQG